MLHRKHYKMLKFLCDHLDYPLGCSQDYGGSVNLIMELLKLIIMTKSKREDKSQRQNLCKKLTLHGRNCNDILFSLLFG